MTNYSLGSASYNPFSESFNYHPTLPQAGVCGSFRRRGIGQLLTDSSFEFIPKSWPRSKAQLISHLSHGRLSKTVSGDYLITIRIPSSEIHPNTIIFSDAVDAMNSLDEYITNQREEEVAV